FLNHRCGDPNLLPSLVRIRSVLPTLCFFSGRPIAAGTELTFDYGTPASAGFSAGSSAVAAPAEGKSDADIGQGLKMMGDSAGSFPGLKTCLCGSRYCRGYLPFDAELY